MRRDDDTDTNFDEEICKEALKFFQKLFTSINSDDGSNVLSGIESSISMEDNATLLAQFKEEEIFYAFQSMGPTKALGFDGYPVVFFQKFWRIIWRGVIQFCMATLNAGNFLGHANTTKIVLISKIQNPNTLASFRPICLCSVLYKLVAKVLANRLQHVIGKCIDDPQNAFVPGRLITDNVLLA